MTRVIKIGGSALTNVGWLQSFAREAAASASPCVIVHGGGPEITAVSEQLGVVAEWNGGRRVTPPAALDAAAMVLSGRVNKRVTAALVMAGVDAVGLSGVDGGLVRADIAQGGVLGSVGRVAAVRVELLTWLLGRGITPVLSPISLAPDGGMLNVNADEVASSVASALGADELLFLTDVEGVRVCDVIRPCLDVAESETLIATGQAWGGMAVKLAAAAAAVGAGIGRVRIGGLATITDEAAGTTMYELQEALAS
jgi:acetylglutamate kinase